MMKMMSLFAIIVLLNSGCVSIMMRANHINKIKPYEPVVTSYKSITNSVKSPDVDLGFLYPFVIIDLPFTALVDTICLPYDCFQMEDDNDKPTNQTQK